MANILQQKREKMLEFLNKLKEEHQDDDSLRAIGEIETILNEKKYGLVWEKHTEKVDEMLEHNIPVFYEDSSRKIVASENDGYNFLLEGDNLHSLKLLEKTHKGKIDVIYIDPPYNTGNKDFIYNDSFVDKTDGYSHSKWLSFMSERLEIARELLSDKGVIFISIDDNEQAQLKLLCDEIFGEENFISTLSVENNPKGRKNSSFISGTNEYCQIYSKSKVNSKFVENIPKDSKDMSIDENGYYVHNSGKRVIVGENKFNKFVMNFDSDKHYSVYYNELNKDFLIKKENLLLPDYDLLNKGYTRYYSHWNNKFVENTYTSEKLKNLFFNGKLEFKNSKIYEKNMSDKIRMKSLLVNRKYKAIIDNKEVDFEVDLKTTSAKQMLVKIIGKEIFSYPKNISYIKLLISLIGDKYCTILDFFAGSGTTGHAVMQLNKEDGGNRKYILCTNNENKICEEVTYQRLKNIQEDLPHNLKYFKTDFISKYDSSEDDRRISKQMLEHVKELIELEHHIEIDDEKYIVLENEEDLEETIKKIENGGKLFISSGIFLSRENQKILEEKNVTVIDIPEYYYRSELKEVGEI